MQNRRTIAALAQITRPYLSELQELEDDRLSVQIRLTPTEAAMLHSQLQLLMRVREAFPAAAIMAERVCTQVEGQMGHKPAVALMFSLSRNPEFDSTVNPHA